jgi:acyl-CoA reductase-like NAD-dependent aldehyde dehydrogenase
MATVEIGAQRLLIGGSWRGASSGASFEKSNPYTGEPAGSAAAATREDARAAVDAAAEAFPGWAATPVAERQALLDRAAELLMERQGEIARIVTEETGATFGWGMFNVELAAGMLHAAGAHAAGMHDEEIESVIPGKKARAVRQPVGVVVGIAPWNAPVILGTRALAAPLALGNTVVLKASEECPRTHGAIVSALEDAGLPAGVVNLIVHAAPDAPDVVDELIAHPAVRRVNFTGSTRVGRLVAENAARHLKRVLLELGGKAPLVVLADADLERAAAAASFGSFFHQGQICMSTERIVIDSSVADQFAERLGERASSLSVGDPSEPSTQIGPMVNEAALKRVGELVEDAVSKGAEVVCGGRADGPCFVPTVLKAVTPEMRIYGEESFGPVVSIVAVDGVDEAVRVANDTEYGLSSAVFSEDVDAALEVASRLETGMCHVNDTTVHDEPQMPFGGVKASGWGRFGGNAATEEFTELRWITVQEERREYPI